MADSKQLRILKKLCTWLTDLEGYDDPIKVVRGKTKMGQENTLPFLSVLEAPKPLDTRPAGEGLTREEDWVLLVQGFVKDDKDNPTDPAYDLLAAVEARLARLIQINQSNGDPSYPEAYLLERIISGLIIGQGIVRPGDGQVSDNAFFFLPLTVKYVKNLKDPYAD